MEPDFENLVSEDATVAMVIHSLADAVMVINRRLERVEQLVIGDDFILEPEKNGNKHGKGVNRYRSV